jgi:anthranilate phosphoribosyltransferase
MTSALFARAVGGTLLNAQQAEELMEELLGGNIATPQIIELLTALNARPHRGVELAGFARAMRRRAALVFANGESAPEDLIDTCGTGGDGSGTFNISTAAAIVAAAAGARVAKHGNRSASSKCGSADVLEALGVPADVPVELAGRAIREIGIGFIFAPAAHASTRHASGARKAMGVRTVFNLLGPLTNPANASAQVSGVFSEAALAVIAEALAELGAKRAFVVHGAGGLDEISLAGPTLTAEVRSGSVRRYVITAADFGLPESPVESLRGGTPAENAEIVRAILANRAGPARDVVVANAAAALVAAGIAHDFREGAERASTAIESGAAKEKLRQITNFVATETAR